MHRKQRAPYAVGLLAPYVVTTGMSSEKKKSDTEGFQIPVPLQLSSAGDQKDETSDTDDIEAVTQAAAHLLRQRRLNRPVHALQGASGSMAVGFGAPLELAGWLSQAENASGRSVVQSPLGFVLPARVDPPSILLSSAGPPAATTNEPLIIKQQPTPEQALKLYPELRAKWIRATIKKDVVASKRYMEEAMRLAATA